MRRNRVTYKRPPACKRNEPSLSETAAIRISDLNNWSNVPVPELFSLGGVNIYYAKLPFIDQLGFDTFVRLKNNETERLENFGKKLFENKLPDWRPPVYTTKDGR